jgi:ABC-type transporter Mla subunit MlaD
MQQGQQGQTGQAGQHGQLLQQVKQATQGTSDPKQGVEKALTLIAQQLHSAGSNQQQVQQLAQELQQHAKEIKGAGRVSKIR